MARRGTTVRMSGPHESRCGGREDEGMSNYEHPIYLTEVEAEMLLGLLAADSATEDGRELHQHWSGVIEQLDRILN